MTVNDAEISVGVAARLISKLGGGAFPIEVLSAYRELFGCDFCAAFELNEEAGPRVIFAEGDHPSIPRFATDASFAYATRYWRLDRKFRALTGLHSRGGARLLHTHPAEIGNADYRRDCYDKPGVVERLALFDPRSGPFVIAGYRSASRGPATLKERNRLAAAGPAMLAAVRRHRELSVLNISDRRAEYGQAMIEKAKSAGLSEREAQVAASLANGAGQEEIAQKWGLAISSVITYRKRAYMKLKVENRRALRAFFESRQAV